MAEQNKLKSKHHANKHTGSDKRAAKAEPPQPFRFRDVLKGLGPGLITGASDDDPSGIGTYSQAGAQLGYGIGWTMLLTFPLMAAIQEISARVGRVTGHGISGNACRHYPAWLLQVVVTLLDLGARPKWRAAMQDLRLAAAAKSRLTRSLASVLMPQPAGQFGGGVSGLPRMRTATGR